METIENFISKYKDSGYGYGYGNGDGSGSGFGDGTGNGSGYGSGTNDGDGYGNGDGYGSGHGNRDGYGDGSGFGSGYGANDGDGYGSGFDLKSLNNQPIYIIDGIQTIIKSVRNNIAKGFIVNSDLTLTSCFIVKNGNLFAHGETLKKAVKSLEDKIFNNLSEDERVDEFISKFSNINTKAKAIDLFEWHNKLTGSCEMGRIQFCKDKGINLHSDSFTIAEFITITENSYGKKVVLKVKEQLKK